MLDFIAGIANVFTIVASGIAIYLFIWKRHTIATAFKVLLTYSFQLTLSELKSKMERLNDLNADEPTHSPAVINVLNDIVGQLRGNKVLRNQCEEVLANLTAIVKNPKKLSEPNKRLLVSELRERLRGISIKNFDDLLGGI